MNVCMDSSSTTYLTLGEKNSQVKVDIPSSLESLKQEKKGKGPSGVNKSSTVRSFSYSPGPTPISYGRRRVNIGPPNIPYLESVTRLSQPAEMSHFHLKRV